jgi:hypothetical protein
MSLRIRRGTEAQRQGQIFDLGEPIWTTDTKQLFVGDGITAGGANILANSAGVGLRWNSATQAFDVTGGGGGGGGGGGSGITAIIQDTAPTLGGNLSLGGHNISGTGNISITGSLSTSGTVDFAGGLGSNLNLNSHNITGTGNINITGTISASQGLGANLPLNGHTISGSGNIGITGGLTLNLTADMLTRQALDGVNSTGYLTTVASRGTLTAPTAIQAGDELGGLLFRAYTNTLKSGIAGIISVVIDPTAVVNGGNFVKSTIIISAATDVGLNPANAIIIDSAGVITSNAISVGDGSASHPSIVFTTDGSKDSGFFHPADGVIGVAINAVEAGRWSPTGLQVAGAIKTGSFNGSGSYPTPSAGMIIFDSSNNHFYGYNGSTWQQLDN